MNNTVERSRMNGVLARGSERMPFAAGAVAALLVVTACFAFPLAACAQDAPHPSKVAFASAGSWTATSPGDVELEDFVPFRAVYDRQYTQAGGPNAGEKRNDRVIVSAEEVGWDGVDALSIHVVDSAAPEFADTNMRALTMVVSRADLRLLFEMGPTPGKAKDYYLALASDDGVLLNQVATIDQTLQDQKIPTTSAGFGPGSWVMASMTLEEGLEIRLDPYYSPRANPISQAAVGRVIKRSTFVSASDVEYDTWIVEAPGWYGPSSSKMLRLYLSAKPPYYFGTEIYDNATEEGRKFVWLRSFTELP